MLGGCGSVRALSISRLALGGSFASFQSKIDVHVGVPHAKILGKLERPLQLLHAIGHSMMAGPGLEDGRTFSAPGCRGQ